MPMPNIAVPLYPDVPRAPGVPNMLRSINEAIDNTVLLAADAAILIRQFTGTPSWGIFTTGGQPVVTGDTVTSMEYRRDYRIAEFPIEQGSFESYNKVTQPYEIQLIFAVSGTSGFFSTFLSGGAIGAMIAGATPNALARAEFLTQLDAAAASLAMFSVVTPEKTYFNVNITHADLRREARSGGATLLKVEVWLQEVRITAKPAFSGAGTDPIDAAPPPATTNAADPAAQPAQNNGQVQGSNQSGVNNLPPGQSGHALESSASIDSGAGGSSSANVDVPGARVLRTGEVPLYDNAGYYVGPLGPNEVPPAGYTVGPPTQ